MKRIPYLEGGEEMKKILIGTVSVLLLFACTIPASGEFHALFKNKKLAHEIGLSDKQIEDLKELATDMQKKMITIRADIELKEIDLREVLDSEKPDEGKAISLIKEIMGKKTEMEILKIKQLISVKEMLTSEQLEKLEEFKRVRRMEKRGTHKGEGPEHRKGKGPQHNEMP
jgi:Spy/CpxP family protein refolding chaperone